MEEDGLKMTETLYKIVDRVAAIAKEMIKYIMCEKGCHDATEMAEDCRDDQYLFGGSYRGQLKPIINRLVRPELWLSGLVGLISFLVNDFKLNSSLKQLKL